MSSAIEDARDTVVLPTILLGEDDEQMRTLLARKLRTNGYRVRECRDGAELLRHLDGYFEQTSACTERYDLIVSDVRMPGVFGTSVVEGAKHCPFFPPTILITAFPDAELLELAKRSGVLAVFSKPFEINDLLQTVRNVIRRES